MKLFGYIYAAVLALLISSAAYGAQKAMRWENGAQCEFETKFDPAKIDEDKLRNTVEVLFGDGFDKEPTLVAALIGPGESLTSNTADISKRASGSGRESRTLRFLIFLESRPIESGALRNSRRPVGFTCLKDVRPRATPRPCESSHPRWLSARPSSMPWRERPISGRYGAIWLRRSVETTVARKNARRHFFLPRAGRMRRTQSGSRSSRMAGLVAL